MLSFARRLRCQLTAVICSVLLIPHGLSAAGLDITAQQGTAPEEQAPKIPNDQLDSLVAPIALYPDPLLAQLLAASTYPLEIMQLQQWRTKHKDLKNKPLQDARIASAVGVGMMVGAAWGGGWCCNSGWGGNNSININNNNTFVNNSNRQSNISNRSGNRTGSNNWQHNSQHRGGTPYSNRATANKYGGTTRGDSVGSRQANARQNQGQLGGRGP